MSSKTSIRNFICTLLLAVLIIQALAVPVPNHSNKSVQPTSPTPNQPPQHATPTVKKVNNQQPAATNVKVKNQQPAATNVKVKNQQPAVTNVKVKNQQPAVTNVNVKNQKPTVTDVKVKNQKPTAIDAKGPKKTSTPQKSSSSDGKNLITKLTGKIFKGEATFYNTGLGACGITSNDNQLVAALPASDYDSLMTDGNPNHSGACGKMATVVCGGKTVTVKIVDRCPNCKSGDIDLSPAAFDCLANQAVGRIQVSYTLS
ncbi:11051_t:CDS:1 [Cetraspora pellucida]|uniref:11051_t:CDS:1 n=1 Tax=Cetraspora pellucida TaxID=1433469 RepID=A0ACA9LPU0_9GLOM|nr:11051_t:CDS:1 [Cetraspora pellucida]